MTLLVAEPGLAQWALIGAYGVWGDSRLKEFDNNHLTKNQVFM